MKNSNHILNFLDVTFKNEKKLEKGNEIIMQFILLYKTKYLHIPNILR